MVKLRNFPFYQITPPLHVSLKHNGKGEGWRNSKDVSHTAIRNKEIAASPNGLITFVLHVYKHLIRKQRYAIYPGQQKGNTPEMIARSTDAQVM